MGKTDKCQITWRNEIKYVCFETQMLEIQKRVDVICGLDVHTGEEDRYTVRSLYFDDLRDSAYYENEMGVDMRRKYRIRMYNGNADRLALERKTKRNGRTFKENTVISREICEEILEGAWLCENVEGLTPLLREFYLEYRTKPLRPKVIVDYERIPYIYETGNVRITFDRNISASVSVGDFLESSLVTRPVMPVGQHVLEVKFDKLLPDHISNAISGEKLRQTAFSKYYLCRKSYGGV